MSDTFWVAIAAQLTELRTAETAADVLRILSPERNPYGPDWGGQDGKAQGFFAGSGGDDSVMGSLAVAGWVVTWRKARYYYVIQAPNGDLITYVEGDIYEGDQRLPAEKMQLIYDSEAYAVVQRPEGVEITALGAPERRTVSLTGDDVATVLEGIGIHAASSSPVEECTDRYLSKYFD